MLLIATGGTAASLSAQDPSERTWKDDTGRFQVQATYQSSDDTTVTLKKTDGTLLRVPVARLSAEDRKHLESLAASNPFVPVANPPQALDEAIVRVHFRMPDGSEATAAGLVFHWDDKRAYVLTDYLRPLEHQIKSKPSAVTIIRDAAGEPRQVAAELVTIPERLGRCIVAAPLADLPGPLQWAQTADVRDGTQVAISGYEIDLQMQTASYARVRAAARINKVFRGPTNEITKWGLEGPDLSKVQYGIASLADGKVIGLLQVEGTGEARAVTVLTTAGLQFMKEPRLEKIDFEPVSGDEKTIRYGFLVSVIDPFGQLKSPKLHITPAHHQFGGGTGGFAGIPPRTQPARPEPTERDLVMGTEKDELVAKFGKERKETPNVKLLVAYFDEANAGPGQQPRFNLTVTGQSPDGKPLNLSKQGPTLVSFFVPQRNIGPPMVPPRTSVSNIPGLDGLPLDMPRPTKHRSGGWQITSDLTRVKEQPQPSTQSFPQPAAGKPAAQALRETESGPLKWTALPHPAAATVGGNFGQGMFGPGSRATDIAGPANPCMTYSHDGSWLYLMDASQVLRKLDAVTLAESSSLALGQACNHLADSQAGLVASLPSARALWVLDRETLAVKREIPLPDVILLSGSPGTNFGFAVTYPGEHVSVGNPAQLFMIDLAKGELLHVIKSFYGSPSPQAILVDDKPIFTSHPQPAELAQTADGRALLLGTNKVTKFRLEGADLVFEQATAEQRLPPAGNFVLRTDDQRLAARADTGNPANINVGLFDLADLSRPVATFGREINLISLALDSKTGNIYSPTMDFRAPGELRTAINIFGPDGAKLASGNVLGSAPWKMLMHPAGERFILWSNSHILSITVGSITKAELSK